MFEMIKKSLMTGVGLAALTREKVTELAHDLASKAKLSEQEGKQLLDELLKRAELARKDLEAHIEKGVHKVLARMDVATREDLAELRARLEKLEGEREQAG